MNTVTPEAGLRPSVVTASSGLWWFNASGVEYRYPSHYPRTNVRGFPRRQTSGLPLASLGSGFRAGSGGGGDLFLMVIFGKGWDMC